MYCQKVYFYSSDVLCSHIALFGYFDIVASS